MVDLVVIFVVLVEKLDLLVGFWVIDEKLIGFKDFYVLCCVVFGVIWIVLENGLWLKLKDLVFVVFK